MVETQPSGLEPGSPEPSSAHVPSVKPNLIFIDFLLWPGMTALNTIKSHRKVSRYNKYGSRHLFGDKEALLIHDETQPDVIFTSVSSCIINDYGSFILASVSSWVKIWYGGIRLMLGFLLWIMILSSDLVSNTILLIVTYWHFKVAPANAVWFSLVSFLGSLASIPPETSH